MPKAVWNDVIIAESDETIVVEGNHYFPPDSVKREYLQHSTKTSTCPWKGLASYYSVEVNDSYNRDAAWYYPNPSTPAAVLKGYVAFWRGVRIDP